MEKAKTGKGCEHLSAVIVDGIQAASAASAAVASVAVAVDDVKVVDVCAAGCAAGRVVGCTPSK